MRIERLLLRNFGRHAELDLEPAAGLTIVRGPNEAGKSTIQRAIEFALFKQPTSVADDVMKQRSWSAEAEASVISIAFTDGEVSGRLEKRFDRGRGTVELQVGGETLSDAAQVARRIAELTGLPSEKFLRATASIHHHELIGLHHDEATLRDRLQQSISGAGQGTKAARRRLEERIRQYRTEGAKNPGLIKLARDEVARLRFACEQGDRAMQRLAADRRALSHARERRATAEAQLATLKSERDEVGRAAKLVTDGADADRRYKRYRSAVKLRRQIDDLEAASAAGVSGRSAPSAYGSLGASGAERPQGSDGPPASRRALVGIGLLMVAVIVLVGAIAVGGGLVVPAVGLALALAAGGLALLLVGSRARGRPAAVEAVAQEEPAVVEVARAQGELTGLLGEDASLPTAELEALRDTAADEVARCRHALDGMGALAADPVRRSGELDRAIRRLTTERADAESAETRADEGLKRNEVDAEKVAADAEALAAAIDRLAAAERRLRIYTIALGALEAAEQKTMKKVARYLEEEMSVAIGRLSGGRYTRLRVDESTLDFSVFAPERGDWVDATILSQGTRDQLYLCARLGIIRQVTAPARPPLILDDPFVTFDDDRARRAIDLLRETAADYQVILLTTSDRYDELADRVIELPAPDARDVAAPTPAAPPEPEPTPKTRPVSEPAPEPVAVLTRAEPVSLWPEES